MTPINESVVEQAALAWLESLGYAILYGPEIAPGETSPERDHYGQVVLERRLWQALGAHVMTHEGAQGTHFAVWAPNAERVSLVGDVNAWDGRRMPMRLASNRIPAIACWLAARGFVWMPK